MKKINDQKSFQLIIELEILWVQLNQMVIGAGTFNADAI